MVALEQKLRRPSTPGLSPVELLTGGDGRRRPTRRCGSRSGGRTAPCWRVAGAAGSRSFSSDEESARFRNREHLYRVVPASGGEAVVEAFPVYSSGLVALPSPTPPGSAPSIPRRSLVVVEVAAPLAVRDASVVWPIRRNLLINCSGALALLATVVIAGLGFRSYARGRRLELQVEIARQVQSELLPSQTEAFEPLRLATVYRPAEQVSGDFYDVFRAGEGRIAIVMGDVSGKGVPAALVMGVIHGAVRSSGVAGVHLRARAGVRSPEPPAVREGLPLALRQHVLVLLRAARAPALLRQRGTLPAAPGRREGPRNRDHAPRRRGPGARPPSRGTLRAGPVRRAPRRRPRPLLGRPDRGDQRGRRGVRGEPVARAPGDGRAPAARTTSATRSWRRRARSSAQRRPGTT